MKGNHYDNCVKNWPFCWCTTCSRDNAGKPGNTTESPCCIAHQKPCGGGCPDYVKEEDTDDS